MHGKTSPSIKVDFGVRRVPGGHLGFGKTGAMDFLTAPGIGN